MKSEFGRAPEKKKKEVGGVKEEEEEEEPQREWFDLDEDDRLLRSGIFSAIKKKGGEKSVSLSGRTERKSLM